MLPLTRRHTEIVVLLSVGMSNDEIAGSLAISPRTVRAHVDEIRRRLGVDHRRQIPWAYYVATGEHPLARLPKAS